MTPDQENMNKQSVLGMIKSIVKNKLQNTVIKSEIQLTDTQTQQVGQIDKIKQDILTKCMTMASNIQEDISKNKIRRFFQKKKQLVNIDKVDDIWVHFFLTILRIFNIISNICSISNISRSGFSFFQNKII